MRFGSSVSTRGRGRFRVITLAFALLLSGLVANSFGPLLTQKSTVAPVAAQEGTPVATAPEPVNTCFTDSDGVQAEPWMQSDLYFGTTNKDTGQPYTEQEWSEFLDNEVTPRFPDGLTVLTGIGQWRETDVITQERSNVLIIVYPLEFAEESSVLLEEIRDAYEEQFNQSSVLRVDSGTPVCVSF